MIKYFKLLNAKQKEKNKNNKIYGEIYAKFLPNLLSAHMNIRLQISM